MIVIEYEREEGRKKKRKNLDGLFCGRLTWGKGSSNK